MVKSKSLKINRRRFMKGAVGAAATISAAPMIAKGLTRQAKADAKPGTIRLLGGASTLIPGDWTQFEKDTGLKMEFSLLKDDPGVFFNDVMVNDAGSRYDIISMLAGVQGPLVEGDWILPIDRSRIPNWAGVEPGVKSNPQLTGMETDVLWGVPMYMNADTFGYFPDLLGEPRPPEEVSWNLVFDNEKTLGQSAVGDNFYTLTFAAAYMKYHNLATIDQPENMTASEVAAVADYMIERKKAGQFRTYWSTFDDQISNFVNGEALAQVCWEPAVKEIAQAGRGHRVRLDARVLRQVDGGRVHPGSGGGSRQSRRDLRRVRLVLRRRLWRAAGAAARLCHAQARSGPGVGQGARIHRGQDQGDFRQPRQAQVQVLEPAVLVPGGAGHA